MKKDAWMLLTPAELNALSAALAWVLNDRDIYERGTFTDRQRIKMWDVYNRIVDGRFERKEES